MNPSDNATAAARIMIETEQQSYAQAHDAWRLEMSVNALRGAARLALLLDYSEAYKLLTEAATEFHEWHCAALGLKPGYTSTLDMKLEAS